VKKSQVGINTPAFTPMTGHPWWVYETSGLGRGVDLTYFLFGSPDGLEPPTW
jgi:hypothetical protein